VGKYSVPGTVPRTFPPDGMFSLFKMQIKQIIHCCKVKSTPVFLLDLLIFNTTPKLSKHNYLFLITTVIALEQKASMQYLLIPMYFLPTVLKVFQLRGTGTGTLPTSDDLGYLFASA
jgi:hypothetical protein